MADVLQKEIDAAHDKLRTIDGNIAALNGRPAAAPGMLKRRITMEGEADQRAFPARRNFGYEASVNDGRRDFRRSREDVYDHAPPKRLRDDADDDLPKKSLASQVVMPAIESKSRDAAITEMRGKEVKEVKQRNKRLFGSLLVGTLQRFQKDEQKVLSVEKAQAEKVAVVEKRLEEQKQEERAKAYKEKEKLMNERRDQERALKALQRKRALIQYADEKKAHYKRLQNFIGSETTPTIFFLPAKHTLQSLELLKQSAARMQVLIDARDVELEKELEGPVQVEEDGTRGLRSHIVRRAEEEEGGEEEEDEVEMEEEEQQLVVNNEEESEEVVVPKREPHVEVRMEGEESGDEHEDEVKVDNDVDN